MQVDEFLLTFRIIAVALTGCFAVGLPAAILGLSHFKTKADAQDLWFYSPLVGAGLVILFCQNLLYLDVPISKSAILVWLLVAAGWTRVLSSKAMRAMLVPVPIAAIGLGVAVYLVHGSGLLELEPAITSATAGTTCLITSLWRNFFPTFRFIPQLSITSFFRQRSSTRTKSVSLFFTHS